MSEREKITVYRDEWELLVRTAREYAQAKEELAFVHQELHELLGEWEVFGRRRFSLATSVDRVGGVLGKKQDPDKTPVDSPFASRKMTAPGGIRVERPAHTCHPSGGIANLDCLACRAAAAKERG